MENEKLLQLRAVNSGYGDLQVLYDLDLEVSSAEIVAVIGPNGAGKSTVIKTLYSLADLYSGSIFFEGRRISDFETHKLIRKGISFVTQGHVNFSTLTVKENLQIGLHYLRNPKIIESRIEEMYQQFPILRTRQHVLAYTLSGGERQMLALARALLQRPKLLLLDEPTLGLSPKLQRQLFEILREISQRGVGIIVIEQNAKRAIESADRTYLLESGKVSLQGGSELLKNPKIKEIYLGK